MGAPIGTAIQNVAKNVGTTQPQSPYTPIAPQGGKGGVQQPTVPAQGGKAPGGVKFDPTFMDAFPPQVQQPISPQIPFEGTGGGLGIPGQGGKAPGTLANTPTLTTGRPFDFSTVINNIGQTVPRAIAPAVQAVAQNIPAPSNVPSYAQPYTSADLSAAAARTPLAQVQQPAPVQTRGPAPRNMQPMATQGLAALMNKRR